jgi:hypothetical protein
VKSFMYVHRCEGQKCIANIGYVRNTTLTFTSEIGEESSDDGGTGVEEPISDGMRRMGLPSSVG